MAYDEKTTNEVCENQRTDLTIHGKKINRLHEKRLNHLYIRWLAATRL